MNESVKRIDVKGPHGTWSYEAPKWAEQFPIVMGEYLSSGGVSKAPYESLNLAFHVGMRLRMYELIELLWRII